MAYQIRLEKRSPTGDRPENTGSKRTKMLLPYGKYSPKESLVNRRLLVLSNYDSVQDEEIYIRPDNVIFTLRRRRYKTKTRRKNYKKTCSCVNDKRQLCL